LCEWGLVKVDLKEFCVKYFFNLKKDNMQFKFTNALLPFVDFNSFSEEIFVVCYKRIEPGTSPVLEFTLCNWDDVNNIKIFYHPILTPMLAEILGGNNPGPILDDSEVRPVGYDAGSILVDGHFKAIITDNREMAQSNFLPYDLVYFPVRELGRVLNNMNYTVYFDESLISFPSLPVSESKDYGPETKFQTLIVSDVQSMITRNSVRENVSSSIGVPCPPVWDEGLRLLMLPIRLMYYLIDSSNLKKYQAKFPYINFVELEFKMKKSKSKHYKFNKKKKNKKRRKGKKK